jgi:flagellar protein FliJ
MAGLNPLIRLRKFLVEEKQKALAELYRVAEALENRQRKLKNMIDDERKIAEERQDLDTHMAWLLFSDRARGEIENLADEIKQWDVKIAKAQDEMKDAFAEMKKIEIIQENRDAEEEKKILKRESDVLDEVGIDIFRRKSE